MGAAGRGCQLALFALAWGLAQMPFDRFVRLGRGLGRLLQKTGFRLAVIKRNMELMLPDLPEAQKAEIVRKNYEHLGLLALEFVRSFYSYRQYLSDYCDVKNGHHFLEAHEKHRTVFVVSAHIGNWEALAAKAQVEWPHTRIAMVTKRLKPAWLNDMAEWSRRDVGVDMGFEPKTMRTIMDKVRNGGTVGFMMDQYAGAPVGARVPFFGYGVGSHTALATLALRFDVAVVPALAHRNEDGRYTMEFFPAVPVESGQAENTPSKNRQPKEQAIIKNTANFVQLTEAWIKKYPEQWLWVHRRFKGNIAKLPANSIGEILT